MKTLIILSTLFAIPVFADVYLKIDDIKGEATETAADVATDVTTETVAERVELGDLPCERALPTDTVCSKKVTIPALDGSSKDAAMAQDEISRLATIGTTKDVGRRDHDHIGQRTKKEVCNAKDDDCDSETGEKE